MRKALDFETFYGEHVDRVYRFVFFRSGQNRALAEDLTGEIFLKALEHFDSYNPALSKTAWIRTIARNHLINFWRDRKQTIPLEAEEPEADANADVDAA